jgi:3-dehydrosphinganine reductase
MKTDHFNNKRALVTGGSSGIGLAVAKELAAHGCNVTILSRNLDLLTSAVSEIRSKAKNVDQKIEYISADITDFEGLTAILNEYTRENGCPDIVVNSAGVAHPGTFTNLKPEIFDWMMQVNYFGTVHVLKTFVPQMQKARSGKIVNISSIAGFIGVYGYTAYGASKFAVAGFSDALRSELKPYGIRVSVVFPPDTQTPQLDYEKEFKPFITKQVAGSSKLMTSEAVAKEIIKGIEHNKYLILPGFESKLFYFLHHFVGRAIYPVMDMMVNDAISKLKLGK